MRDTLASLVLVIEEGCVDQTVLNVKSTKWVCTSLVENSPTNYPKEPSLSQLNKKWTSDYMRFHASISHQVIYAVIIQTPSHTVRDYPIIF